jgi:hypothetical protein
MYALFRSKFQRLYWDVTRQTVELLRLKCELVMIALVVMVSALELDLFGQFCHKRPPTELNPSARSCSLKGSKLHSFKTKLGEVRGLFPPLGQIYTAWR